MMGRDLHPTLREALALHEAFRRLGFIPEDIYFRPEARVHVTVKRGDLEFNAYAGPSGMPQPELIEQWRRAAEWFNTAATEEERQAVYRSSKVLADSVGFVAAVIAKGFNVRKVDA